MSAFDLDGFVQVTKNIITMISKLGVVVKKSKYTNVNYLNNLQAGIQ